MQTDGFREDKVAWNSSDFRFTARGRTLYAFMLRAPENRIAVLKSLSEQDEAVSVRLLGAGECPFSQAFGVLTARLPVELPTKYTNVLAVELA